MTAQDNKIGRPFDFFVDHFLKKCEVRTSQENKEEGLLISLSTSSKTKCEVRTSQTIKEKGLLISLSTSS
jgi:hypothetical protein